MSPHLCQLHFDSVLLASRRQAVKPDSKGLRPSEVIRLGSQRLYQKRKSSFPIREGSLVPPDSPPILL